jgi:hypothetical protein
MILEVYPGDQARLTAGLPRAEFGTCSQLSMETTKERLFLPKAGEIVLRFKISLLVMLLGLARL